MATAGSVHHYQECSARAEPGSAEYYEKCSGRAAPPGLTFWFVATSRRGYGQFCPVAKAAEILAERWTPLVVRELLNGSRHFGQLQRGIPLISPTMLSRRLQELEGAGVIERQSARGGDHRMYRLTEAGRELAPVIDQLGVWGQRWAVQKLDRADVDPAFLIWAMHRRLNSEVLGPARVVIAFDLLDAPANRRHWWLVASQGQVDVCLKHPGHPVDVTVVARLQPLARVWLGHQTPQSAVRTGTIHLSGAAALIRTFPRWCPRTKFSQVPRSGSPRAQGVTRRR
jgi:DNA-binding HxlR family transcriptional regulator